MSDMKTQIKITTNGEEAAKEVEKVSQAFGDVANSAEEASDALNPIQEIGDDIAPAGEAVDNLAGSLDGAAKAAGDAGDALGGIGDDAVPPIEETEKAVKSLRDSLDQLEKQTDRLGKSFTKNITAPVAALAAISLKNLYDTGAIEGSTGVAREFAIAVQDLRRNFVQFSIEIGSIVAPAINSVSSALTSAMNAFRALDDSTKRIVVGVSLLVAAIGPLLVAGASLLKLFVGLAPVFKAVSVGVSAIAGSFSAIPIAIAGILGTVAGLVNVFLKLRQAGQGTAEALLMSFNLFVTGFNNYVVGTILDGVRILINSLGSLAGVFNKSIGDSLKATGKVIDGWSKNLSTQFQASKGQIDSVLSEIGSSAGDAFTFGLSSKLSDLGQSISGFFNGPEVSGQLESEMGKSLSTHFKHLEALRDRHNLSVEQAQFEHQQRMLQIDTSADPSSYLEARLQKEREFLDKKHQLERQDLQRSIETERLKLEAINDLNERNRVEKEIQEKYAIETTKLTNAQELETIELTNKQIEDSYKTRYEKASQYAMSFSSGLGNSFIEIAEGSKTAGKALEDFARNFIRQMAQMILQATIYRSVMSGLGLTAPTVAPVGAQRLASGGIVRGPGTGTSDSIPAWLSDGEYVIRAAAVKKLGKGFLDGLNGIASGGVFTRKSGINSFADGGLVSSPSVAPQVVIENKGSEKQVTQTSYDPKTAVVTVVMEDIGKNGPISKAFQNKFGVRPGGFS